MKRASFAAAVVGALVWACSAELPEVASMPPGSDGGASSGADDAAAGARDASKDAAADGDAPKKDAGGSGTSAFLPGEYETEGQARCDILETRLTLDPLTLDPFGANGAVVFTPKGGASNVAEANDVIIVGNPGVSCTITQSGDSLTVHCTHPTQGECTEVLAPHD